MLSSTSSAVYSERLIEQQGAFDEEIERPVDIAADLGAGSNSMA